MQLTMSGLSPKLVAPLPGNSPAGRDLQATSDKQYYALGALRTLQEKRERKDADGLRPDWALVKKESEAILSTLSKDLEVTLWLTQALVRLSGHRGLLSGIQLMLELYDRYPQDVYPREIGRRSSCFGGLDRLRIALGSVPLTLEHAGRAFTLLDWNEAEELERLGDAKLRDARIKGGASTLALFNAAAGSSGGEFYSTLGDQLEQLNECIDAIEHLLETVLKDEDEDSPTLTGLRSVITSTLQLIERWRPARVEPEVEPDPEPELDAAALLSDRPDNPPDDKRHSSPGVFLSSGDAESGLAFGGSMTPAGDALGWPIEHAGGAHKLGAHGSNGVSDTPVSRGFEGAAVAPVVHHLSEVVPMVQSLVALIRSKDPLHPWSYLLTRALRWGELYRESEGGGALLDAPKTETRRHLKALYARRAWKDLLEASERVAAQPEGRGWLDLQFFTWEALLHQGDRYEPMAELLVHELRVLLTVFPSMVDAELLDGTPAVGAQTRAWLRDQVFPMGMESGALVDGAERPPVRRPKPNSGQELPLTPREQAQSLHLGGKTLEGLEVLHQSFERQNSRRARFISQLETAEYLLSAKRFDLVRSLLLDLGTQAEQRTLEDWEDSATCVRLWSALYRLYVEDPESTNELRSKAKGLFDRICKVDAAKAARLIQN